MSRARLNGSSNGVLFHFSTITLDEVPTPRTKRPGAAAARVAAEIARVAGPRVNTGTIAVPRRSVGAHTLASARGVKASATLLSDDHTSV